MAGPARRTAASGGQRRPTACVWRTLKVPETRPPDVAVVVPGAVPAAEPSTVARPVVRSITSRPPDRRLPPWLSWTLPMHA